MLNGLLQQLVSNCLNLIIDQFGNYIIQYILEKREGKKLQTLYQFVAKNFIKYYLYKGEPMRPTLINHDMAEDEIELAYSLPSSGVTSSATCGPWLYPYPNLLNTVATVLSP